MLENKMSSKNQGAASKNSNTDNQNGSNIFTSLPTKPTLFTISMLKLIYIFIVVN